MLPRRYIIFLTSHLISVSSLLIAEMLTADPPSMSEDVGSRSDSKIFKVSKNPESNVLEETLSISTYFNTRTVPESVLLLSSASALIGLARGDFDILLHRCSRDPCTIQTTDVCGIHHIWAQLQIHR